jgi:hypothetical protein
MSDEFDYRDWKEDLYDGLRNKDNWFRGLKIVVLSLFLIAVRVTLALLTLFQFCHCLFRNRPSEAVIQAGPWLGRYVDQSIRFMTWHSDRAPFPFAHPREVMEDEPAYRAAEAAPDAEEEQYAYEEERYDSEPPAPPPGAEDALPEDNGGVPEDEALPEDESTDEGDDEQPSPPPRPDA